MGAQPIEEISRTGLTIQNRGVIPPLLSLSRLKRSVIGRHRQFTSSPLNPRATTAAMLARRSPDRRMTARTFKDKSISATRAELLIRTIIRQESNAVITLGTDPVMQLDFADNSFKRHWTSLSVPKGITSSQMKIKNNPRRNPKRGGENIRPARLEIENKTATSNGLRGYSWRITTQRGRD